MQKVAESRKNMKVDLRPHVLAKTMTKELVLVSLTLFAVISKFRFKNIFRSASIFPQSETNNIKVLGKKSTGCRS
jgi:hypothetical protein